MRSRLRLAFLALSAILCLLTGTQALAMYDPGTGRFLQRDPAGYPDGMNAYGAYHAMRGGVDPMGLDAEEQPTYPRTVLVDENGDPLGILVPDHINCLGHATGFGCSLKPFGGGTETRGRSLRELFDHLGYECRKLEEDEDCECEEGQDRLIVYIYKYIDNVRDGEERDPFEDPWITSPGRNDYHLIHGPPGSEEGVWDYVPHHTRKTDRDAVPRTTVPGTEDPLTNPDLYWRGDVPTEHRYCCCYIRDEEDRITCDNHRSDEE